MKSVDLVGRKVEFKNYKVEVITKLSESHNSQVYLAKDQNNNQKILKYIPLHKKSGYAYYYRELPTYQLLGPHSNIL